MLRHSDSVNKRDLGSVLASSLGRMTCLCAGILKRKREKKDKVSERSVGDQRRGIIIPWHSHYIRYVPVLVVLIGVLFTVFNARGAAHGGWEEGNRKDKLWVQQNQGARSRGLL